MLEKKNGGCPFLPAGLRTPNYNIVTCPFNKENLLLGTFFVAQRKSLLFLKHSLRHLYVKEQKRLLCLSSGQLNFCILIFNSKRFIHYWQSRLFIQCCFRGNDGFHRFHRKLDEDRWNTFVLSSLIKVQQHYSPLNCYENDTLFTCKVISLVSRMKAGLCII